MKLKKKAKASSKRKYRQATPSLSLMPAASMSTESLLDQNFNFHEEMLSNMFELYIDLVTIFVTENHLPDSRTGNA